MDELAYEDILAAIRVMELLHKLMEDDDQSRYDTYGDVLFDLNHIRNQASIKEQENNGNTLVG